jgi:endonuclease-3
MPAATAPARPTATNKPKPRARAAAPTARAAAPTARSAAPTARSAAPTASRSARANPEKALAIYGLLHERHPDAHCELEHRSAFELLIATVLSAQSTDVMVNKITPEVFRRWPTPFALAAAEPAQVEQALSRIGMFRQKTRNIIGLSKRLVEQHEGQVPRTLAELVLLPGVGRKTANVVLGVAFGAPEGVVVDTHVQRLSQRLGLSRHSEPVEIERDLMRLYPQALWDPLSHTLIFHGRRVCTARKPACAACPASQLCPSAFRAERVGRKPGRLPALRNARGKQI